MMKKCCWLIWGSKSGGKKLGQKNNFHNFFFCKKKVNNIKIVAHPYLAWWSENVLEVFHESIANLADHKKWYFFTFHPKIDWFPMGPFRITFVKNNWWGVSPSCKTMKKCCGPIWVSKSGKNVRTKNWFSKIWFVNRKICFCNKVINIQIVTHPYLARLSKKISQAIRKGSCNFLLVYSGISYIIWPTLFLFFNFVKLITSGMKDFSLRDRQTFHLPP